jgi:tetratricopeptide (TPR) repeat protein
MRKKHDSIGVVIFSCLVFLGAGCVSKSAVNSPDYYYNQGTKLMKRGEYVKSISKFTKTIEMKKSPRDAYHQRGIAYEKIGSLRKALNDFESAIEIDDQYHKAFASRAMTYLRMRKYRKARKDARKALELKPGYSSAYYVLGAIEKRKGNKTKAIEYLSKSIKNDPKRIKSEILCKSALL